MSSSSSGSTGEKTISYFDRAGWLLGKYLLKARARYICGVRPSDRIAVFQQGRPVPACQLRGVVSPVRHFSIEQPAEQVIEALDAYSPSILYGFPSYLVQLAAHAEGRLLPRLTFTSGEMLDDGERARIERALDTRVMDVYGCSEVKEVAWQCPLQRGYHINADWLLVEVADDSGRPVEGEGALLLTGLYNFAMPLIRYEVGDTGRLLSEPCTCGVRLPLMNPRLGRKDDYIVASDGSLVSPMTLMGVVRRVDGVRQYQIVQSDDGTVTVRIVVEGRTASNVAQEVRHGLETTLKDVPVRVIFQPSIARQANGKFRFVIAEGAKPMEPAGVGRRPVLD